MKKVIKYGCLSLIAIFLIITAITYFASSVELNSDDKTESKTNKNIKNLYSEAITSLEKDDFVTANIMLGKIILIDSVYPKIDSIRTAVNKKYNEAIKIVDKELAKTRSKMHIKTDEFQGVTWVHSKVTKGTYGNSVYCYFGINDNKVQSPRFVIRYYGDDWLFWNSVVFLIDGEKFDYTPNSKPKRDNSGGSVWETSDEILSQTNLVFIKKMFDSKQVKYRLNGRYYKDLKLSKTKINAIKDVLKYHYTLDGYNKIKAITLN